jgi:POT family proton-dependent oligopeptide transporter
VDVVHDRILGTLRVLRIRWALVLYIVAQFHAGDGSGQAAANLTYGSSSRWCTPARCSAATSPTASSATSVPSCWGRLHGGRPVLISVPNQDIFKLGLATIIVGNGMFKPNISTMVGKLYDRRSTPRPASPSSTWASTWARWLPCLLTEWLAERSSAPAACRRTRWCSWHPASAC